MWAMPRVRGGCAVIFAKTYKLILAGKKTQTLRLAYPGDKLLETYYADAVETEYRIMTGARTRWRTGATYAVPPERCRRAVCRIRCTSLREVLDPLAVDKAFARAEGFD